jgi:hypothetical protein
MVGSRLGAPKSLRESLAGAISDRHATNHRFIEEHHSVSRARSGRHALAALKHALARKIGKGFACEGVAAYVADSLGPSEDFVAEVSVAMLSCPDLSRD